MKREGLSRRPGSPGVGLPVRERKGGRTMPGVVCVCHMFAWGGAGKNGGGRGRGPGGGDDGQEHRPPRPFAPPPPARLGALIAGICHPGHWQDVSTEPQTLHPDPNPLAPRQVLRLELGRLHRAQGDVDGDAVRHARVWAQGQQEPGRPAVRPAGLGRIGAHHLQGGEPRACRVCVPLRLLRCVRRAGACVIQTHTQMGARGRDGGMCACMGTEGTNQGRHYVPFDTNSI